jgi:predicted GIY-YIG superfamily endonuclease
MADDTVSNSCTIPSSSKRFFCYVVHNAHDNTYNGYTVDLRRRLKQHNGFIKGGARATRNRGPWRFLIVLTSDSWDCISTAMRHEWSIKYPTRRRPRPKRYNGASGRLESLSLVFDHMLLCDPCTKVTCYVDPDHYTAMAKIAEPYECVSVRYIDDLLETEQLPHPSG